MKEYFLDSLHQLTWQDKGERIADLFHTIACELRETFVDIRAVNKEYIIYIEHIPQMWDDMVAYNFKSDCATVDALYDKIEDEDSFRDLLLTLFENGD